MNKAFFCKLIAVALFVLPLFLPCAANVHQRGRLLDADRVDAWGSRLVENWAMNGQCMLNHTMARNEGPGLVGRCGAQVFVLDLTRNATSPWPGTAGHVDFYMAKTGSPSASDGSMFPYKSNTMYEMGSTSKALTTTLTQILVDKGIVSWDQTVDHFFPEVHFDDPAIGQITMSEMSTHTSGLPSRPWNLPSEKPSYEPYANFTEDQLLAFLTEVTFDQQSATPEGKFIYCNNGFGLMGMMIERATNKSYETLLNEYIFNPLGLNDSSVDRLTSEWATSGLPGVPLNGSRMSPGHDRYTGHVRVRRQPYGVYKANGAVKSTAQDILLFLQAGLLAFENPNITPAVQAFNASRSKQQGIVSTAIRRATAPQIEDCPTPPLAYAKLNTEGHVGRAWQNYWSGLRRIVWKSGNTRGFATMQAFDPARGRAVMAFDTCGGCDENKIDKLAMMMLEGPAAAPLPPVPSKAGDFSRFAGEYYINICDDEDVDKSGWFPGCSDCHEKLVSLKERITIQYDAATKTVTMRRSHWSAPVKLHPFGFTPGPSHATLYPERADPVGFSYTGPDWGGWINPEHRNKGRIKFVPIDTRLGVQQVYFITGYVGHEMEALVLHSGGIDNFAYKDKLSLSLAKEVCGVGAPHWNGLCRE